MITRFAPSPTGPLHLGHAFSALTAFELARNAHGRFVLRIEDIDRSRARAHWEEQIYTDLQWIDISWENPVARQSERQHKYQAALQNLWAQGLLYPCTCTRADIKSALGAPQEGVATFGADGMIYPGTCHAKRRPAEMPRDVTLRLDMRAAVQMFDEVSFEEQGIEPGCYRASTTQIAQTTGDFVVARKDMATSYHLAVVVDDAAQEITHVVRGADIQDATYLHVVLQKLLDLPTPLYHHHALIRDAAGKRLAKRDDARALAKYRTEGVTPADIRRMVNLPAEP